MSKFSILHISDIHKIEGVEYEPLFQSLRRDMDSYTEHEGILPPTFVVERGFTDLGDSRRRSRQAQGMVIAVSQHTGQE